MVFQTSLAGHHDALTPFFIIRWEGPFLIEENSTDDFSTLEAIHRLPHLSVNMGSMDSLQSQK